jgi:hypothetical protein
MRVALLVAVQLLAAAAHAEEVSYLSATASRLTCGDAPVAWTSPDFDDRAWRDAAGTPDGGVCSGTRFQRWRFDTGAELKRLVTLTLRVKYTHGFAAYLNGVEIARQRLLPAAAADALATEPHGLEPERFFIPATPGLLRAKGNVLAIEVHPFGAGREPIVDAELSGADGPRVIRGPYLTRLSAREVTVMFETDLQTVGQVRYGVSEAYDHTIADAPPSTHHMLRLVGLSAATAYHYRVTARTTPEAPPVPAVPDVDAGDAVFHTPPAADGRPLRFVVYGDVRTGHDVHAQLNRAVLDEDPDFALVTGDLVDRGSDEGEWDRFFDVAAHLVRQLTLFPAPGNHEYARLGRGAARFFALFRWPLARDEEAGYYSFDQAGVHFVALDSNQYRSPHQVEWLERDLAAAEKRGARAIFVYAHEGAWSSGMHGDNQLAIHDYAPVLERHHVTVFFYGHDHHYERGRVGKLNYVVTGGGGADLRPPKCGVPGKRACDPRVAAFFNEHHYVLVEVMPTFARLCPKRVDGSLLEACTLLPLR